MVDNLNDCDLSDLISFSEDENFSVNESPDVSVSVNDNQQMSVSKRRRIRKKKTFDPFVKIRVLRSDIRRSYSGMLANVLNSYDYSLMFGFLDTFLTRTAEQTAACSFGADYPPIMLETKQGVSDIFQFWCSNLHTIPDSVMKLKNTCVTVPVAGCGSKVMSTFTLEATSIYDMPFPGVPEEISADAVPKGCCEGSKVVRSVVGKVTDGLSKLSLRQSPLRIVSEGRFILTLDDEKRITGVDMVIVNNWNGPMMQPCPFGTELH